MRQFLFRLFPAVWSLSRRITARFTPLGALLAASMSGAALFGADPYQTHAFRLAALLLAAFIVAGIANLRWRPRLRIERVLPAVMSMEQTGSYRLIIHNLGRKIEEGLIVKDHLSLRFPTWNAFIEANNTALSQRDNWFDRRVGFLTWARLVCRLQGGETPPLSLPTIPAQASISVGVPFFPARRGHVVFSHVEIHRPDPLGLLLARFRQPLAGALTVLPVRHVLPPLPEPAAVAVFQGQHGIARAVGQSNEFLSLRDYRPGDAHRHIHWRSFARQGKPIVIQFAAEQTCRHTVIVDPFLAAADETAFEALVSAAASLMLAGPRPGEAIDELIVLGDPLQRVPALGSQEASRRSVLALAELQSTAVEPITQLRDLAARNLLGRNTLFVLSCVWDAAREQLCAEWRRREIPFIWLHVQDAPDMDIDPEPTSYALLRPRHLAADLRRNLATRHARAA